MSRSFFAISSRSKKKNSGASDEWRKEMERANGVSECEEWSSVLLQANSKLAHSTMTPTG